MTGYLWNNLITILSVTMSSKNIIAHLVFVAVCTVLHVDVVAARGCSKNLRDECTGSIPVPLSLKSHAELLGIAKRAENLDHPARDLFSIPPHHLINRTCAIYHGLRGCAGPVGRLCPHSHLMRYQDFRTSFNELCGVIGRISYRSNYKCLTNSTKLDAAVRLCLNDYRASAVDIGNTNVSSKDHMTSLCRAGQALKVCSMKAVTDVCGQYSREFWFQFSFPRDRNLESQRYCNDDVKRRILEASHPSYVNQSAWITCDDGSNIIPYSYMCDQEWDCFSGQDEMECDYNGGSTRMSTVAIVCIIIGVLVLIVVVICVVKARKEAKYTREYSRANSSDTKDGCSIEVKEVKEKELETIS